MKFILKSILMCSLFLNVLNLHAQVVKPPPLIKPLAIPGDGGVYINRGYFHLEPSSSQEFLVSGFNTNFILPTIRVNFFEEDGRKALAKVSAFNSIGAGISFGGGRLRTTTDEHTNLTSAKFKNTFSIQLGILYSVVNTEVQSNNVFAVTLGLNALNFNLSVGKEFGNLAPTQKRHFITLSYNIPLSELIPNSFYVTKNRHKGETRELW